MNSLEYHQFPPLLENAFVPYFLSPFLRLLACSQLSPAQSSVSLLLFSTCIAIFLSSFHVLLAANSLICLHSVESQCYQTWLAERYHVGWLNSHAIGLCVSTTTTVKTTKAAPVEIEAPRQVLDHNLIFWL